MRKRSKRIVRPISSLISPNQHAALMLLPRIHWTLMQAQDVVDIDYQKSVLGIFNLGVAIAHLKDNAVLQHQFESAQLAVVQLIEEKRRPTEQETVFLSRCFNQVDPLIGIQTKASLIRAIEFVDHMIGNGRRQAEKESLEEALTRA